MQYKSEVIFGEKDTFPLPLIVVKVPSATCTFFFFARTGYIWQEKIGFFGHMVTNSWINDPRVRIRYNNGCKSFMECTWLYKSTRIGGVVTSNFPMILYKRWSCSFVKGRFSLAKTDSLVVVVRFDTISTWKLLLGLENSQFLFPYCGLPFSFQHVSLVCLGLLQ